MTQSCKIVLFTLVGLWGLVNNAGILGHLGPSEWLRHEDYLHILNVNTLGTVRVVRTFLPLLKRSKAGARIVNTSSILGKLSIPFSSPYCMSKYALEAFSDSLRYVAFLCLFGCY